ncbi:MAG TPA: hypothetical protein VKA60_23455 [Blastocatellia bacterium]|nr:hypothetical protein [Blastocatellia bacterium]
MTAPAPEPPRPATLIYTAEQYHGPACEWRKWAVRQRAAKAGVDADALARQHFGCDLDSVTEAQAVTLQFATARIAETQQPTTHRVICITCEHAFDCACGKQHTEGECHYCHENTSEYAERRRVWRYGF